MLLSLAATGALVLLQSHVIRRTHSAAVKADSLHYRSDFLSNGAVLIALGLAQWGYGAADPILAIAIALYMVFASREILAQALNELLDRELPQRQRERILACARSHPQVHDVHDLRTRRSGRTVIAQLHIELDGNMTLHDAHRVADDVEAAIIGIIPGADVVIHQDPAGIAEARLDARLTETPNN
jgi:ferrous-iron efflux pump FieF